MRGQSPCSVCCGSLCQHPECWRSNLQQVREAVWRRNGVNSPDTHRSSVGMDTIYLRNEQRIDPSDDGLPTLKIVDMFSDLDGSIKSTPRKHLAPIHQRSSSLPCLPSAVVSQDSVLSPPRSPRQSPAMSSPPLTEYQRRMKWKKQFAGPSRIESASNSITMSTIGVHELYEENEMDQEWQEVYVTSAYLVWCPSNKKRRKGRRASIKSSNGNSSKNHSKKVIFKDVTEDLVPASMETTKQCRPKSTKTPTGGQPFSPHPHKPLPNPALGQYGMGDLSDLPQPVLSGILKRINWRSNEGTPNEDQQETKDTGEEANNLSSTIQQESSKMLLAVDINSRFTTPEEDEQMEEQLKDAKQKTDVVNETTTAAVPDEAKLIGGRELLSMHPIGLPIDDLPEPKHHHCTNSIPRRMSLGVALEPVNIVPIKPFPTTTPREPSQYQVAVESTKPNEPSLVVNVPSGRPESAPMPSSLDVRDHFDDRYYVNSAFRYTPSPVRAPAPTPISPDKYSEFARYSRGSRRKSSSQDEQLFKSMRRWNTLSSVYDTEEVTKDRYVPVGQEKQEFEEGGGVFITEGFNEEIDTMAVPTPRCRSPSPGSRTCIPKDIIEQFQGDIYGRGYPRKESQEKLTRKALTHVIREGEINTYVGTGIVAPGWRPPRSRTPIQLSETPARYPPRPLRQPPPESIPKSLQIVSIAKQQRLWRPRSTPPRTNIPNDNDTVPLVLSETSLVNQSAGSAISMEVRGPSSNINDPGAIPPPPSPEATLTLKNELQPTLETLCEEDERSSRNTSIADLLEKEIPLSTSRLSPLGGGSEMSDESVDLPIELDNDNDYSEELELEMDQEDKQCEKTLTNQHGDQSEEDLNLDSQQPLSERVGESTEESSEQNPTQQSSEPNPDGEPSKEQPTVEPSQPSPTEESSDQHPIEESSEPHPIQVSPEPQQTSADNSNLQENLESSRKNSFQDPHQPPGSPEVTSNHDFTEGLDMELDLAAELQAAMEGLDDFNLDDDADVEDDDEN